jgi:APA family basic amino acid/polyamine antiporter
MFARDATGLTRNISGLDALIANLASMGLTAPIYIMFFASLLYPGVNLPLTVLVALVPSFVMAAVYYLLTVSMPRAGGDYVWASRIIHPSVGLITNLFISFGLLSFIAVVIGTIPAYGIGPMLAGLGQVSSNQMWVEQAGVISMAPAGFEISFVALVVVIIPAFIGTRTLFRALWGAMVVAAVSALVMTIVFFSTPQNIFIRNFNSLSGMNYQNVITNAALTSGFNFQYTLYGSVFTILNFAGYNNSAYYTGEVKQVRRSQFLAMFGAVLIFALFLAVQYMSVYHSVGSDFYAALSALAGSSNPAYTLPVPPVLTILVAYASPNPYVISFVALGFILTQIAFALTAVFIVERNFFAWSFDRLLPNAFTALNRRGTPYVAAITIFLLSVIFAVLYWYTTVFEYFLYSSLLISVGYAVTCVASIMFPYTCKGIFESSPEFVKRRIVGVRIITILGIVGLIIEVFISYATLLPAVTPPPSGPPVVGLLSYMLVPVVGLVGAIMYVAACLYRRSQGLDLTPLFKQVPPE